MGTKPLKSTGDFSGTGDETQPENAAIGEGVKAIPVVETNP